MHRGKIVFHHTQFEKYYLRDLALLPFFSFPYFLESTTMFMPPRSSIASQIFISKLLCTSFNLIQSCTLLHHPKLFHFSLSVTQIVKYDCYIDCQDSSTSSASFLNVYNNHIHPPLPYLFLNCFILMTFLCHLHKYSLSGFFLSTYKHALFSSM